jgi:winged helix DNA-binding protein
VPARKLSERELNRALLARQLLLDREKLAIPKALERIGGIQAQAAPSMYVGLWTRLEGFEREALDDALEKKKVAQGTLMRQTIHLVSAGDWWPIQIAIREPRRAAWEAYGDRRKQKKAVIAGAAKMKKAMAKGPLTRKAAVELIKGDSVVFNGTQAYLDQVRVPPSGTWAKRRADVFQDAAVWLKPEPKLSVAKARAHLIKRYLEGFGPSTVDEIADWSGLPKRAVTESLGKMKTRTFEAEDGAELIDIPGAPLPDPDTPAPVRFLPQWDATMLAHTRRSGILPEEFRRKVFNPPTPQANATVIVDGRVAATWKWDEKKKQVATDVFGKVTAAQKKELAAEADALAELHLQP